MSAAELAAANPKRERIRHASLTAAKLPRAFSINSPREQQLLAAAAAYRQRWMAGAAEAAEAAGARGARLMPAVSLLNECEAEKMVCNTLRPAALPHLELYDLEGVAQVRDISLQAWGDWRGLGSFLLKRVQPSSSTPAASIWPAETTTPLPTPHPPSSWPSSSRTSRWRTPPGRPPTWCRRGVCWSGRWAGHAGRRAGGGRCAVTAASMPSMRMPGPLVCD